MAFGKKNRYYCVNLARCTYASSDHVYSEQQFRQFKGLCRGEKDDGCGEELKLDALDVRPKLLAAALAILCVIAGLAFVGQYLLFPPAVKNIVFAAQELRATEAGGTVSIVVNRLGSLSNPASIEYRSMDGTAKASEQYEEVHGKLVFGPGEQVKTINVPVLPAHGALKSRLYFSIQLPNAEGAPQQMIYIEESKERQTLSAQAEQTVRNVSVVAMNIADLVVRERVTESMLEANRGASEAFKRYQDRLRVIHGDLQRARERYEESFRQMTTLSSSVLQDAMDKVDADLARQGFAQQSRATAIMKRQYGDFLANKTFDMDKWANELSTVIPKPSGTQSSPST